VRNPFWGKTSGPEGGPKPKLPLMAQFWYPKAVPTSRPVPLGILVCCRDR